MLHSGSPNTLFDMSNLSIYLVEDDPFITITLKHMLVSLGHRICGTSCSYEKAVTDLASIKPDLVVTDIMLSGKGTGIDLGKYINKYLHIPFIYQSSITADDMLSEAKATLPEAYLVKPVRKMELAEAIEHTHF